MSGPQAVGRTAYALGVAGLLPQAAAVAALAGGDLYVQGLAAVAATGYAAVILSFLGGIWWGFAMRRHTGQAALAVAAVVPSLFAFAVLLLPPALALVALGLAILATLAVDNRLERAGDAGPGWTRFRTVLSVGLGVLTLVAGLLAHRAFAQEMVF